MCTLPSANIARMCRTMESPIAFRLAEESEVVPGGDLKTGARRSRGCRPGLGLHLPLLVLPGSVVKDIWEYRVLGARGLCKETHGVGGGSVSIVLCAYPGLMSISLECFQHGSPLLQLGLLLHQVANLLLNGLQLELHRVQLKRVLTFTQR